MGIIDRLFPAKTTVTADTIRAEIERAEGEIASLRGKCEAVFAGLASMTDAEHIAAEADIAATKRAIVRLDARVAHLTAELPAVAAAEESAKTASVNEALRKRAESVRRANEKDAAKLLAEYDLIGAKLGDILARLNEIAAETNSVNADLAHNPVAESITGYETLHRKHPDRQATERREMLDVWVHADGTVTKATKNADGSFAQPLRTFHRTLGYDPQPMLERREVVVGQTYFRPGHYESPLSAIILPPGLVGNSGHWPRK